jgi:serine/threonine protein kinase
MHKPCTALPSPPPQAPEVLTGHAATAAADIYAFGLVLWELLAWRLPWGTRSPFQVGEALQLGTCVGDEACLWHTVGACLLAATTACGTDTPPIPEPPCRCAALCWTAGAPRCRRWMRCRVARRRLTCWMPTAS